MADVSDLQKISLKKGKDFWGPPQWATIHILSFILKSGNEKYLCEYYRILTHLLPCDTCKLNLSLKLDKMPPEIHIKKTRGSAFLYSYMIHDLANQNITATNPSEPPKISPYYEQVKMKYEEIIKSGMFYRYIWASIHILSITLRQENILYYKEMMNILCFLLPERDGKELRSFLLKYPMDPYLRNNKDVFLYSYMLHDHVNRKIGKKSPNFQDIKIYYFSALSEECNDCRV